MRSFKFSPLVLGVLLVLALCRPAKADTDFNFSITGVDLNDGVTTLTASGQLTAIADGTNYLVTGITGTVGTSTITALYAPEAFIQSDNLLVNPGPIPDLYGISFLLSDGDVANLYSSEGISAIIVGVPNGSVYSSFVEYDGPLSITAVTSATPEPGTLALLGTGALGMVGMMRRRLCSQ